MIAWVLPGNALDGVAEDPEPQLDSSDRGYFARSVKFSVQSRT